MDRCPGTSWAGSRRTGSSHLAAGETTPDARSRRGDPGRIGKRCPAPARGQAARRAPSDGGSRRACRTVGEGSCAPPQPTRWPRGCRGHLQRPRSNCCAPCGSFCRSGGSAAGRARRSPWLRRKASVSPRLERCRAGRAPPHTNGGTARTTPRTGPVRDRPPPPVPYRRSSLNAAHRGASSAWLTLLKAPVVCLQAHRRAALRRT